MTTSPDGVEQQLAVWRATVLKDSDRPLVDTDTALMAITEGKHRREQNDQLWTVTKRVTGTVIAFIVLAVFLSLALGGCTTGEPPLTPPAAPTLTSTPPAAELLVPSPIPDYDRKYFNNDRWAPVEPGPVGKHCTVRDLVIYNETLHSGQTPIDNADRDTCLNNGKFRDRYTGQLVDPTVTLASIDHIYSQKEAWDRGAYRWPAEKRNMFHNDQRNLVATTEHVNSGEKGDRGPDQWQPSDPAGRRGYAMAYDLIAREYGLDVTPAERAALDQMLATPIK